MVTTALRLCTFVFLAFRVIILLSLIKGYILWGSVKAEVLAGCGRGKAKGVDRADRGAGNCW